MKPDILFENEDFVCAVKPAGVLSEEASGERSMVSILKEATSSDIYPIHRLDRAVGGVMIYAKNKKSAAYLSALTAEGGLEKTYLAAVHGKMSGEGEMSDLLFKDSRSNKSFIVKRMRKGVKEARLTYSVLCTSGEASLVRIKLVTGRSHQIRVQFSSRKHPLFGDGKYGGSDNCPIALFSHAVSFIGEKGEKYSFSAIPEKDVFPWNKFDFQ